LPEVEGWKPNILQSNLNMKFVQTKEEFDLWKKTNDKQNELLTKRRQRIKDERIEQEQHRAIAQQTKAMQEGSEEVDNKQDAVATSEPAKESSGPNDDTNEPSQVGEKTLEEMSKTQLKKIATSFEVSKRGTKEELKERITEAREKASANI